ncbi:MAG TPA: hypothetical protein VKB19_04925 [Pedobacter sp.]|nr:hypothetical protein [Pedobacter sp.]
MLGKIQAKTMLSDLRKIADEIKKVYRLATELWITGSLVPAC